jgi:hypothetical protein
VANRFPIRFSLARLLIILTAIILLFGYTQARRHSMRREAAALEREGVTVSRLPPGEFSAPQGLPNDLIDKVWQRRPTHANLYVMELTPDKFRVGDDSVNRQQLFDRLLLLDSRVRALGAQNVNICADGAPPYTPSNWVHELNPMTEARILACKQGDRTYDYIPGITYDE